MNKIIVSEDRCGGPLKMCDCSPGNYNIGDIVEVQEGKYRRLSVIAKRQYDLTLSGASCGTCIFRNQDLGIASPCGYVTSDRWYPCVALMAGGISIRFEPIDTLLEEL